MMVKNLSILKILLIGGILSSTLISCGNVDNPSDNINNIDNYRIATIGNQTWMAENLNYDPGKGNSACYNNNPANCDTYGRLYDWATAMDLSSNCNSNSCASQVRAKHRGVCPSGWHIPSKADWEQLLRYVDSDTEITDISNRSSIAGKYLKATSGWNDHNGNNSNGTDNFDFSALPGGCVDGNGLFGASGNEGLWWSSSESHSLGVYSLNISYSGETVVGSIFGKSQSFSVRCVKD